MIKIGDKSYSIAVGNTNIDKVYVGNSLVYQKETPNNYLTFSSANAFTIEYRTAPWDGTLYYSTDTEIWAEWNGYPISAVLNEDKYYIYLRGANNTILSVNNGTGFQMSGLSAIWCSGNIETLLDYTMAEQGQHPTMGNYCYYGLFKSCSLLVSAPELPATTLSSSCYAYMFNNCTALITAPNLPATSLTISCYDGMFLGCSHLLNAPSLPATTLANACYSGMFRDCTALTTAPSLPATTLANACYAHMFRGCSSLTNAPALPALSIPSQAYAYMFKECRSLTSIPDLPATTLSIMSYIGMFTECTSLTTLESVVLPATTLAFDCYREMFSLCSNLTTVCPLPATTLAQECYMSMFQGCSELITLPLLPATTLADACYHSMFYDCRKIKLHQTSAVGTSAYRIPSNGTGTDAIDTMMSMFANTGGSFTGTPTINTTYYTSNQVIS